MTDGQWQIVIGIAALVVAIIGLKLGPSLLKRRQQRQHQTVGDDSIAIQSGRDTNVDRMK